MQNKKLLTYYQKSSFFLKISRYIVTLIFIIFIFSCVIIFGRDITAENIQLLAKYISLNDGSSSLYTEEFSITADDNSDFIMLSDNIAVVRKNNISLYDLSGQKLFSYNYSYSSPACVSDDRNILVYDITGNEMTLFNSFSKIKSISFSYPISFADISSKGITAVSGDEAYRSALSVFDQDYDEIYKLYSSENHITSAVYSPDGRSLLSLSVSADKGSYTGVISIHDIHLDTTAPVHSVQLHDELPIKCGYSNDKNSIFVITDSNIHFYDTNLKHKHTHKFNQSKAESYYIGDNFIILTERNNLSGNSMTLTGISKSGDVIFEADILDEISDISIGNEKFFALGGKAVYEFSNQNHAYSLTGIFDINEKYISILNDSRNNCYVISHSKVRKVHFDSKIGENNQ